MYCTTIVCSAFSLARGVESERAGFVSMHESSIFHLPRSYKITHSHYSNDDGGHTLPSDDVELGLELLDQQPVVLGAVGGMGASAEESA